MNCEDNSELPGWTYCGKASCEACGGEEYPEVCNDCRCLIPCKEEEQ